MDIAWTVVGILVPVLIGVGFGVLGYSPAEYKLGRWCFWLSAGSLGGMQLFWEYETERPAITRVVIGLLVWTIIGVGLPELLRWVNRREKDAHRPALSEVQSVPTEAPRTPPDKQTEVIPSAKSPASPPHAKGTDKPLPVIPPSSQNPSPSPPAQEPPPIQDVRIVSQEWVPSTNPKYRYDLKVIIQTNVVISPVSFVFVCNNPIAEGEMTLAGEVRLMRMEVWDQVMQDPTHYLMAYRSPSFTPEQNIVLNLFSDAPIKVISFEKVPFPRV